MDEEIRKKQEAEFHNFVRSEEVAKDKEKYDYYHSNRKFYEVARTGYKFQENWLKGMCGRKRVLVLGCGEGAESFFFAKNKAIVYGIDIADGAIETAKKHARELGVSEKCNFLVMDAENLKFEDDYFDIITASGMIHHIDFSKVLPEMLRVIKKKGAVICIEPLKYNPIFQIYRKLTPHLRTKWEAEHILGRKEIFMPLKYFKKVEPYFFYFFVFLATPFRKASFFKPLLSFLEKIDSFFLKIPIIKWLSWQVVFIISEPKK
ncbi:MAG: class I SAM-dependent methyltransferase [Candidatus Nealsonbacteria bacterium]|nr:class I SAM-dependent methyltransferase [Candidatus Nealsonbacteria bacterium]